MQGPRLKRQPNLRRLDPTVRKLDVRIAIPPEKEVDPYYNSQRHKAWREKVVTRAGGRCEWIVSGQRCENAAPEFRMYADHIKEREDGGSDTDVRNGQCLCPRHHALKTNDERFKRQKAYPSNGRQ